MRVPEQPSQDEPSGPAEQHRAYVRSHYANNCTRFADKINSAVSRPGIAAVIDHLDGNLPVLACLERSTLRARQVVPHGMS